MREIVWGSSNFNHEEVLNFSRFLSFGARAFSYLDVCMFFLCNFSVFSFAWFSYKRERKVSINSNQICTFEKIPFLLNIVFYRSEHQTTLGSLFFAVNLDNGDLIWITRERIIPRGLCFEEVVFATVKVLYQAIAFGVDYGWILFINIFYSFYFTF